MYGGGRCKTSTMTDGHWPTDSGDRTDSRLINLISQCDCRILSLEKSLCKMKDLTVDINTEKQCKVCFQTDTVHPAVLYRPCFGFLCKITGLFPDKCGQCCEQIICPCPILQWPACVYPLPLHPSSSLPFYHSCLNLGWRFQKNIGLLLRE